MHPRLTSLLASLDAGNSTQAKSIIDDIIQFNKMNQAIYAGITVTPGIVISPIEMISLDDNNHGPIGDTPLILASKKGLLEIVEYLIHLGAAVNKPNRLQETPLIAAAHGSLPIMQTLVSAGADLEQTTVRDETALSRAIEHGNLMVIGFLLDQGAPIQNGDKLQNFLLTQDPENDWVLFCQGILHGSFGVQYEKECYQQINFDRCPQALRRLGQCYEEERNLDEAIACYKQAAELGDLLCINRLVTLAKNILSGITTDSSEKEEKGLGISDVQTLGAKHQYIMAIVYDLLIANRLQAPLSSNKWSFVAEDALGSSYFETFTQSTQFAVRAVTRAKELAQDEEEKFESQRVASTAWKFFARLPDRELSQIAAKKSVNIIKECLGDEKGVEDIKRVFVRKGFV